MRLRILSRASDLARLQARLVGDALLALDPNLDLDYLQRPSAGDLDRRTPLAAFADKGAFTADLSEALAAGSADLVVHSWKDLPVAPRPDTSIAATLERADPRDILLVRDDAARARPGRLTVLSSSPRRAWLLEAALPGLLPWPLESVATIPVRGNVPTRLRKLVTGEAGALVVAKAALDRLLAAEARQPFQEGTAAVRSALARCRWTILPLRDVPAAPAQGALAIEIAGRARGLKALLAEVNHAPTWRAVQRERAALAERGGGCHAALGATVLIRPFGEVLSLRSRGGADSEAGSETRWELTSARPALTTARWEHIWPTPADRKRRLRWPLDVGPPNATAFWVSRAEALPTTWTVARDQIVWAAGSRTWRKLAARGVWVHGCADGLGDAEAPGVDLVAGRALRWCRLTHSNAGVEDACATYHVDDSLPDDLPRRTHFFWTSGSELRAALSRWPELANRWHACGPGRTAREMVALLGHTDRCGVWLDYDHWLSEIGGR